MIQSADNPLSPHPVLDEYYADGSERRRRVDGWFDASARHYDWITNVMSLGSGRFYRRQALLRAGLEPGMALLDVGAGTGVVSLLAQQIVGDEGLVVAHDPSRGMLEEGRRRGVRLSAQGLGESLPYPDHSFDRISMGYALRHVADLRPLFEEFRRVLKPGGKVLILEITRPQGTVGFAVLRFYMRVVIPTLTRLARRSAEAQELMRYYWDTIETCVPPATILAAMHDAALVDCQRRVELGIFSEYTGIRA